MDNVKIYLGKLDRWSRQRNESELVVKDFSAEVRIATYTSLKMPSGFELCEAAVFALHTNGKEDKHCHSNVYEHEPF